MDVANHKCLKCGSEMELGQCVGGEQVQLFWRKGPARRLWEVVVGKRPPSHTVWTYRCLRCGYLESYAIERLTV